MAVLFVLVHLLPLTEWKEKEKKFLSCMFVQPDKSEEKQNKSEKKRIVVENLIYYWICGHNKPSI